MYMWCTTEVVSSFSSTKNYQQLRSCADSAIDGTVATATMMIQRMKSTHQDEVERIQSQIEQERQSHRAARAIETAQREEETRKLQSQVGQKSIKMTFYKGVYKNTHSFLVF